MAIINMKKKEIQVKIVYYGPGRGGKTTNLEYIFKKNKDKSKSEMIKLDTRGDRTLFFDFLPISIKKIGGFDVRIHLYTAPGQQRYDSCRKVVLNGADGVVFVADSMEICREKNILSFDNLKTNLGTYAKSLGETPLVVQCNKWDLSKKGVKVLAPEKIMEDLSVNKKTPCFEASALYGQNVVSTLRKIIVLSMGSVEKVLKGGGKLAGRPVGAAA